MKIFSLILSLLLITAPAISSAEILPPDELIKATVHDVLLIINQDKRANDRKILEFIDAKVLPHFDFERMTKLAVGRPWRTATPEQKAALVAEFRTLLVRTYSKAFTTYKDVSVDTKSVTVPDGATEVTIKTVIRRPGAPVIPVNYEMEKTDAGWKAFDVTVEGISLVATHRGSFAEKVQQDGIDGLIKSLVELNKTSANKAESK
ncbi:MAG TPA: ABC transporter substrate-binding protein [Gallionellaceae bacterium]|nr:ABC transporter substrate-binding protein [Gallionellaceae bacterium]